MIVTKTSTCSQYTAKWSCIVILAGVFSLFLQFMFMYIPSVGSPNFINMDWHLGARLAIAITVVDAIFLFDIIFKYRTSYMPPNLFAFERHEANMEPIYSKLSFIFDLLAIMPLPQTDSWRWWIVTQIPFKAGAMSPIPRRTIKMMGILVKSALLGALQNLLYFMVISNAIGALYNDAYLSGLTLCRRLVNGKESDADTLAWDELITRCTEIYGFECGILLDAFTTKIGTRSFVQRYTYCLAWGLKSLSSFGQIFSASSYSADIFVSFIVVIFGLVLFGDLLAKMQTTLQCTEVKEDRQRTRQRKVEEWMKYHQLPQFLKKQVQQAIQSEWSVARGIDDETILDSLPRDIRADIRRQLYMEIIRAMPLIREMDDDLQNAICSYLRTFSSNKGTYVEFEGEPVRQMLFVFSGQLEVSDANNGKQCIILGPGDLCGKELLEWCSHPTISTDIPKPATQTIKCITDVDAFSLWVDDVKLLAIQFHRNGKFRHAFQQYIT